MAEDQYDGYIDEGAEYSPKSEFSKPALTYKAFERCIESRAKEMKKGYYNTTVTKDGLPIRSWVEDSRKVYCSAVQALMMTLAPELIGDEFFYKDKDEDGKEIEKNRFDFTNIEKRHRYKIYESYDDDGKTKYKVSDKSYMPEVDAIVDIRNILPDGSERLHPTPGAWNKHVDCYWNEMVGECDKLYRELMRVIHRINYFKQSIRFG